MISGHRDQHVRSLSRANYGPCDRLTMLTDDTKVSMKAETDECAGVNVDTCTVMTTWLTGATTT